jgi:hypothetical protein
VELINAGPGVEIPKGDQIGGQVMIDAEKQK